MAHARAVEQYAPSVAATGMAERRPLRYMGGMRAGCEAAAS